MRPAFEATVSALCYSIVEEHDPQPQERPANDVVRFVLGQHARMPDYLRLPVLAATLLFDWWGIMHLGRRFHRCRPEMRRRQIESWRRSRLSCCRDLMRFYEGLAVFAREALGHGRRHHSAVPPAVADRALAG